MRNNKLFIYAVLFLLAGWGLTACSSEQDELMEKATEAKTAKESCDITGTVIPLAYDSPTRTAAKMRTPGVEADASIQEILKSTEFTAHCLIKVSGANDIKHTEVELTTGKDNNGENTLSVKDVRKVFRNAVGREPQPGEVWKVSIVAGGGKWDEVNKRVYFCIEDDKGVSSRHANRLIAPLATDWTTVRTKSDGSYDANLVFSVRGTLVRLDIQNELTAPFVRSVLLNSKALCRNIYFDMSSPSADGKLVWKPLVNDKPTVVTNGSVPAQYTQQFVFWGMPTHEQDVSENEFAPDAYGYTFVNETNDKLYRRKGDFVSGKVSNLVLRIARIKLPIEYFDKKNYNGHGQYAFTNSSYNNQSYYVYNRTLDILSDLDRQNKGWHVPSVFEWAAVVPRSHGYTEEAASKPLIYLDGKSNHLGIMEQNEEVESPRNNFMTYRSQYVNIRKGVNYAVRFAPPTAKVRWRSAAGYNASFHTRPIPFASDYRYYAAYKYEVVENAGDGHRGILVTVRYLGESGKHLTLKDINDDFWRAPAPSGINDIKVFFPFYGYMDQGVANTKVRQQEKACYYWTVTPGGSLVPLGGWMTYITAARSISLRDYQLNETHDGRQYRYLIRLVSSR